MKKLLFVGALMLGLFSIARADSPRRWNLTVATGTYNSIFTRYGYLLSIQTSAGTENSLGEFGVGYSTQPRLETGGANGAFTNIWSATTTVIPPIIFRTTATVSSGDSLSGIWRAPTEQGVYVESDFYWNQSAEKSGGARQTTIIWSK